MSILVEKHNIFSNKYLNKIYRFIRRHSDNGVKHLNILKNFNFLNSKGSGISPMAFITKEDKQDVIYINKKVWPKYYYMSQGILLHEIGHHKTGLYGKPIYLKEFKAQKWAIKKAKKFNDSRIYKWLYMNLFMWGLRKNFDPIYRKASKLAFKKGIINRECLDIFMDTTEKNKDKTFKTYCKNIKKLRL